MSCCKMEVSLLQTVSAMTKNKITILSTRPLDMTVVDKAAAAGIDIDTISFIDTAPITNDTIQQQIIQTLAQPATVVFTSMNAVEAVAVHAGKQYPAWNIFCIGHTTRDLATRYFGASSITGTADNALLLAEVIIGRNVHQPVVFFCGDQRRNELPDKLRQYNIPVQEITVYTTTATSATIDKPYNGILFFSPSAVHSFFISNTLSSETVLFAIGETTANSIREHTTNTIITADTPGKNNLAELAIHYFTA
jgi:uroporphyrinogen-III synthase